MSVARVFVYGLGLVLIAGVIWLGTTYLLSYLHMGLSRSKKHEREWRDDEQESK